MSSAFVNLKLSNVLFRKRTTDPVGFPQTRSGSDMLFVNFTPDRVSVCTDRYSYLGTVTRVCNYFTGRIHLHCWRHQLLPWLGHILLMVEFPELALFRILTCIHFSPGRVLPTPFFPPRPVFFTPRPGAYKQQQIFRLLFLINQRPNKTPEKNSLM